MKELLKFFSDNKDAIIAIGIVLTLVVSILSLYYSKRNNQAVHYVNSITKNRVEWIYKLREYISEYVALVTIDEHTLFIDGEEELSRHFEKVRLKKTNIQLLLNYTGKWDSEIIRIIEELERKSTKFYGSLKLLESITDNNLEDIEIDKLVAENTFVRSYVVDFMKSQGYTYSEDIFGLCFFMLLLDDIKKLRYEKKLSSWDVGICLYNKNLIDEIKQLIDKLVQIVQVYLKFEWNRVKYEGQGKEYYKGLQQFDMEELLELSQNPQYKLRKLKRQFIYFGQIILSKLYWFLFFLCAIFILFYI